MAPGLNRNPIARRSLTIVVTLLVLTTFAPARFIRWATPVGELASNLIAPVSRPAIAFSRWVKPAATTGADPEDLRVRAEQADHFRTLYLRELSRNDELRERIRRLQSGVAILPETPVRLVTVPVLASASDASSRVLRVRAGSGIGVVPGTPAAIGVQLVGRTIDAGRVTSQLRVLTDPAGPPIRARVLRDGDTRGLLCTLEPQGVFLRGPVESIGASEQPPAIGDEVRLDDPNWRRSAQMLIVGVIERIDRHPDQPLRMIISVRPTIDLARVSEVVLRIPQEPDESDASGEGDSP